ncbi:hypothetical protein ACHAWO_006804 [Cyclotella atomus]|jgi:hypothetical protein|uniref:DDRGK domain-containing protein 1 n=1 Tax=Cyclotella atomus TaxID=382360 RepID=A0ABD3NUD2_9STRA
MSKRPDHNDNYNVVLSNQTILILCTIGFASIGIAVYFLILRRVPSTVNDDHDVQNYDEFLDQSDVGTLNRAERRARAKLRMKKARRANVPAPSAPNDANGDAQPLDVADVHHDMVEDAAGMSRKERQKAAKALEKEERKISAEIARARREAEQKKKKHMKQAHQIRDDPSKALRLDDIFPLRTAGTNDPLNNHLFHESITRKYKDNMQMFLDDGMQSKIRTVGDFIDEIQLTGSASLSELADEFGIAIDEVCDELKGLNDIHGVIGVFDQGNFVYVSKEMIEMAVVMGKKMGRVPCPVDDKLSPETC